MLDAEPKVATSPLHQDSHLSSTHRYQLTIASYVARQIVSRHLLGSMHVNSQSLRAARGVPVDQRSPVVVPRRPGESEQRHTERSAPRIIDPVRLRFATRLYLRYRKLR
jgi:hypothetical protein